MSPSPSDRNLAALLRGLRFGLVYTPEDIALGEIIISSMTADSREVEIGALFVALPGVLHDGHDFVEAAAAKGCQAILCQAGRISEQRAVELAITVIEVEDIQSGYAAVAANYFRHPAEKLHLVGLTGTNGKTTVSYLLEQVLLQAGRTVGVIGTVNNRYTGADGVATILKTQFTTPEAFLLQKLLRKMVDSGVHYVVMEVSSHALAQARIGSLNFEIAAFTNLSRDHLDYHGGMEAYFKAKALLFSDHLAASGTAVLPLLSEAIDDVEWLTALHAICRQGGKKSISWGEGEDADVCLESFTSSLEQTDIKLRTPSGRQQFSSPLVGRFNIDNLLSVYSICLAMGLDEQLIRQALAQASGAPGRLERVSAAPGWDVEGPVVLVDYAHTPDALEKALTTVAALPHGQLYCVFGCGGDRDNGKRPLMGAIAGRIADVAIVTDDNPRTEDPDQIIDQIVAGISTSALKQKNESWLSVKSSKEQGFVVIRNRKKAIENAIRGASAGDIVVIAGKGHEPYQLTHEGKRFFDDRMEAQRVFYSWTPELVASAVGGELSAGSKNSHLLGQVFTDSRLEAKDGIFVALKGENHDAHDYAVQAVQNGASCLVVEHLVALPEQLEACQVVVKDSLLALGDLAAFRRQKLAEKCEQQVIGLTGSCGKTTVKEMVASILNKMWPAGPDFPTNCLLKTAGNFNNLIGMPLSLLPLDVHHRLALLEMGMNQPGELKRLGSIADPDISCITNIHGAHLEGLQSIEGVARAKEELFAVTKKSGILVINLDDSRVRALARKYPHRKISYAVDGGRDLELEKRPDLWASKIRMEKGGELHFTIHYRQKSLPVHLAIAGEHNVSNGLCAAALAIAAGAELHHVATGLADFRPPDKRMQMVKSRSGFTVINDTYNANPASMAAGLKTLKVISENSAKPQKSAIAIIGDMRELGEESSQAHYDIGWLIGELQLDCVALVGAFKEDVAKGAMDNGYPKSRLHLHEDKESAVAWMKETVARENLNEGDVVLVKASRGPGFETIVSRIVDF